MSLVPTAELAEIRDDLQSLINGDSKAQQELQALQQLCLPPTITKAIENKAFVVIQTQNVQQYIAVSVKAVLKLDRVLNGYEKHADDFFDNYIESGYSLEDFVNEMESSLIRAALKRTYGNKKKAADLLNCSRTTLNAKIARLDIKP
jgi:transcriptional regulator with PAS, ATPase and Fis domain